MMKGLVIRESDLTLLSGISSVNRFMSIILLRSHSTMLNQQLTWRTNGYESHSI